MELKIDERELVWELENKLKLAYKQYENLYQRNISSVVGEDVKGLNRIQTDIVLLKVKLNELKHYPEIYNRKVPRHINGVLEANKADLHCYASELLRAYRKNEDYRFIKEHLDCLEKGGFKSKLKREALKPVEELERDIKKSNFVRLRYFICQSCDFFMKLSELREELEQEFIVE